MNNAIKNYLQPSFLICIIVLALAGSSMSFAIRHFGVYLKKEPMPLKKALDLLDEQALKPYVVVRKQKIENKDVLAGLGTEDYIQWVLEDKSLPENSPTRRFLLFITYYSLPDRVPHVPEECYTGGGYQRVTSEAVVFNIDKPDFKEEVPGRLLVFAKTGFTLRQMLANTKFPVVYFFKVNGKYGNSREDARIALNKNIFGKSSYFSKVELVFNQKATSPDREEALKTSKKILSVILPTLEAEHWPAWDENERKN